MTEDNQKKEALKQVFNKGQRVIETAEGRIDPEAMVKLPASLALKLVAMFPLELLILEAEQSADEIADQAKAQEALKKQEDEENKKKPAVDLREMSRSDLIQLIEDKKLDIKAGNMKAGTLRNKIAEALLKQ